MVPRQQVPVDSHDRSSQDASKSTTPASVARTRTCLACKGTGADADNYDARCHDLRHADPGCPLPCQLCDDECDPLTKGDAVCPACLGSGRVTDPAEQPDARVDAMALQVMKDSLGITTAENRDLYRRFGHAGAFVLVLALLAGPAWAGERTKAVAIWCGAKAADLATTELALSRGGFESNPLMRDRAVRYGAGIGSCVLAAEADHRLRGHKKARWAVRILGLGLLGYAVQRNARVDARGGAR